MYSEVALVLVSSETQVQPQIILDPNYLSVSYDYRYTFGCFFRILCSMKNEVWSNISAPYGKHFQLVFISITKTGD